MKHTGEERFRCVVVWMLLVIIILLCIICFSGCVRAEGEKTEYYPNGEKKSRIKVSMTQCMTDSARSNFQIDIPDMGKVELGSSMMNAEEFAAMLRETNPILALLLGL